MAHFSRSCILLTFVLTQYSFHYTASSTVKVHHQMTVEELEAIFHVSKHSDVPKYEVVQFHSIRKREIRNNTEKPTILEQSERIVKLEAFGKQRKLSLQPSKQLFKENFKMWLAESDQNGSLSYTEVPDAYVGEPYQDEENHAALLLHKDDTDGSFLLEGTIGHDLVIKPLPAHIRRLLVSKSNHSGEVRGDRLFTENEISNEEEQTEKDCLPECYHHHVVYRRHLNSDDNFSDFAFMEAGEFEHGEHTRNFYTTSRKRRKRSIVKREAPYTIYPEILVIVDYDGYRLHGGDNVQVKRYFVSFWNAVDLRYKLLKSPKVRISIAGLIISRGRDATPYLERNRVGRDAVDSAAALTDMGKYLFRERRLPVYDIAVAVTKLDMCRRHYQNDVCNRGTAGFAYVGGACVVNKRLEKVNSVAIIEDTGGFSGIIVAAHEVGHLLGAVHDGSPPPTYLGGPGAEKCRWEDGYIMSDLRHSEKGFKWSPCSVASFHHFLNGDTATCLYNSPHEDESLPRVLPGKLLSLDAQCRRDRGTSACFKDERVCSQLFCFDSGSGYCVAYRPAAEGSPCGDGQTCSSGVCTSDHENIIPDYSQNSATFVRRQDYDSAYLQKLYPNNTKRSEQSKSRKMATKAPSSSLYPNYFVSQNPFFNFYYPHYHEDNFYGRSNKHAEIAVATKNSSQNDSSVSSSKTKHDFPKIVPTTTTHSKNLKSLSYNKFNASKTAKTSFHVELLPDENGECVDKVTDLPGAISCYDYLSKYGLQHCADCYIQQNCCAAVKYVCNNEPL